LLPKLLTISRILEIHVARRSPLFVWVVVKIVVKDSIGTAILYLLWSRGRGGSPPTRKQGERQRWPNNRVDGAHRGDQVNPASAWSSRRGIIFGRSTAMRARSPITLPLTAHSVAGWSLWMLILREVQSVYIGTS
jgi:hypothetical protein